jgi:hypothetical protein
VRSLPVLVAAPFALAVVLGGCATPGGAAPRRYTAADQSIVQGTEQGWRFDAEPSGAPTASGQIIAGTWTVRAEPDAPSPPNALCQTENARWPVLLLGDGIYADLHLSTRFKPLSGREDQAAGLVFRAQDGASYFVARANALENNVRLYTMRADNRTEIASADRPVAGGIWHDLAIEARGDRLRVRYDGEWVIEHQDATYSAGRIGLWTTADSQTCFDDVLVSVPS